MSITDELREFIETHLYLGATSLGGWKEAAFAIADRIDAEHERIVRETGEEIVRDVRREWVRLPVDEDGVPIHVGDVMDSRVDYLFDGKPFTVRALVLCEDGWEVADGRFGNRYELDSLRHHHAPTVEDLLFSYGQACIRASNEAETDAAKQTMLARLREDYATKLRLAGDAS